MRNVTVLDQDGTGALACLRRGNFASTAANQAGRITRTNTALLRWYADDAAAVLTGTGSVPDIRNGIFRTLLTQDNTGGHIRVHSLMGQVKAYDSFWNTEVVSAVHGRLELVRSAATMTLGGNGITAAVLGVPSVSGAVTVNTNHLLAGVAAVADFRATLTQTGRVAAFLCAQYDTTNWSDGTARTTWGYGLLILNSSVATGVEIGNCTTGLIIGTATTAITLNGAVTTGIAIPSTATTAISITGAATDAIKIATGAMTDGIEIESACTNGINISGACTTAVVISGDATTAINITSGVSATNVISIAATAGTAGINLSGDCTTGIVIGAQTTAGITISGITATGISITGANTTSSITVSGSASRSIMVGNKTTGTTISTGLGVDAEPANNYAVGFFSKVAAAEATSTDELRTAWIRTRVNNACTIGTATGWGYGVCGAEIQLKVYGATINSWQASALWAQLESQDATTIFASGCIGSCVLANVGLTSTTTIASGGVVAGVTINSNTAASGVTATGGFYGLYITQKTAGLLDFQEGIHIDSGSCTMGLNMTCASIGAAGRIAKLFGTCAAGNMGDGYGAVETDLTLTGTVAGTTAASSTWINMAASSSGGSNMICAQNNGIWVSSTGTPMASATAIIGMRMQYIAEGGENPGSLYLFSTNIYDNVLTAMFHVNAVVDLGGSTGAQTGNDYKIPLFRDVSAGQTWYVNVYHS